MVKNIIHSRVFFKELTFFEDFPGVFKSVLVAHKNIQDFFIDFNFLRISETSYRVN